MTNIIPLPAESHPEYIMRVAAVFITKHCPTAAITFDDEPGTGTDLADCLLSAAQDLATARDLAARGMSFPGKLVQAGGDDGKGNATLTLTASTKAIAACARLPLYQLSEITIIPQR